MSPKTFYLTTTLPYVNADPHIGFALEIVQADIIARYHRLMGREVFFNTGTDEHGQKIFQKAQEEGTEVQAYTDHFAERFKNLKSALDLSYGAFIRTTDPNHVAAAQELWRRCSKDIYKKKYKGLYCVGDEAFLRESDLVNGECPNHPGTKPIEIEEENYFFRLSAYQDKLSEYLSGGHAVVPDWRREEALKFVGEGLEDFSISREKARMSWGVPVPNDDTQVMYVWFDALTNYISTLGWPTDSEGKFKKFWEEGEVVQMAGKDQVRFQSVMWQAMLMSAGVKNSDKVVYHGFITSGGHKMSKSVGNVVDPLVIVAEYGTDALRYFLARHVNAFEDSDFTLERFKELYNADLANGLGNLVARIMQLAEKHIDPIQKPNIEGTFAGEYAQYLERFEINRYADLLWDGIKSLDRRMTETQPFKVIKSDIEKGKELVRAQVEGLYIIAHHLYPIMPKTSELITQTILDNKKPANLFARKD